MVSKLRLQRINERIQMELSDMLVRDISDPRLLGISITGVRVDRELAFAEIYFSALEGSKRAAEILEGLEHAKGYLRHELAVRIDLRTFPHLRFHWDPTFEKADSIEKLFSALQSEKVEKQEPAHEPDQDEDEPAS
ncbi:MAG TPA: 30S ribosome-binding factor RbfA [Anaerolineales bacterium]|nr:30S ribosome-binding factor RbfA [Anaerolineales bacterium]